MKERVEGMLANSKVNDSSLVNQIVLGEFLLCFVISRGTCTIFDGTNKRKDWKEIPQSEQESQLKLSELTKSTKKSRLDVLTTVSLCFAVYFTKINQAETSEGVLVLINHSPDWS